MLPKATDERNLKFGAHKQFVSNSKFHKIFSVTRRQMYLGVLASYCLIRYGRCQFGPSTFPFNLDFDCI